MGRRFSYELVDPSGEIFAEAHGDRWRQLLQRLPGTSGLPGTADDGARLVADVLGRIP